MKLLLTNENRGRGGAEIYTLALARALSQGGHEVVLAVRPRSWLSQNAPNPTLVPMRNELDLLSALQLRRLAQQADVVHCQATRDLVLCSLLPCRTPLFKSEHTFLGRARSTLLNRAYRRCRRVIAVSQALRQQIRQELPGIAVEVVPNGIDLKHFAEPVAPLERLRQGRWIGCLAGLLPGKGQDDLLRAFARLDPDLRLVLAGEGPEGARLEELAQSLGVAERVWFCGHLDDPRQALAGVRVAVVPSHRETFSLACLEALAMDVPLVASRTGGIPEVCGDAARLVEPGSPDDLEEALRDSLSQPRRGGREQARRFSQEVMVQNLERVYLT